MSSPSDESSVEQTIMKFRDQLVERLDMDRKGKREFCNGTLITEGRHHKVHTCVLGVASEYFKKAFPLEFSDRCLAVVSINEIPHERLLIMLDFMYTGVAEITEDNVLKVLADAEFTETPDLINYCCSFLEKIIQAENCLEIRAAAKRNGLDKVVELTNKCMVANFDSIVCQEEFFLLDGARDMPEVLRVLQQQLHAESAFSALVTWMNYDLEQRQDKFFDLFTNLDLKGFTRRFLSKRVVEEPLVRANPDCTKAVMDLYAKTAQDGRRLARRRTSDWQTSYKQRQRFGAAVIGGIGSEKNCTKYDMKTKENSPLPQLSFERCGAVAAVAEKKIYVMGGSSKPGGSSTHAKCEMLDVNEDEGGDWKVMADMKLGRYMAACAVIGDRIYVTGGRSGTAFLSTGETFDTARNLWCSMPNMLQPRSYHAMAALGDCIYCIGNFGTGENECYDRRSGKWRVVAPLNVPRSGLATVALEDDIYAIGGLGLTSVERYDSRANAWLQCQPMKIGRSCLSAIVMHSRIYAIGGTGQKTVEEYDPYEETWTLYMETKAVANESVAVGTI